MQLKQVMLSHIDEVIMADVEAIKAVKTFFSNLPGRLLEVEIDTENSNKQGIIQGDSIYKFGIVKESEMAFIEFYENRSQGEPTMSLYVDKQKSLITIRGWKVDKKFHICYKNISGKVEKACKME